MAILKNNTLVLQTGKQIKLMGETIAIGPTLEIGEGYSPRLLFFDPDSAYDSDISPVSNSYSFTEEEIVEVLDYIIAMATLSKSNIRRYGMKNPAIFNLPGT
ncbi:hypothetical protein [Chitinophaga sp. YIM B06452]|uniref:hypothetical protein n=1 Tax=Chitinophaga sp. YIM B06452 TaxID=3082158 RepID=UPI0031FE9383